MQKYPEKGSRWAHHNHYLPYTVLAVLTVPKTAVPTFVIYQGDNGKSWIKEISNFLATLHQIDKPTKELKKEISMSDTKTRIEQCKRDIQELTKVLQQLEKKKDWIVAVKKGSRVILNVDALSSLSRARLEEVARNGGWISFDREGGYGFASLDAGKWDERCDGLTFYSPDAAKVVFP